MKTRAAVLWERNTDWSVEEIDLDPPKSGEVLVSIGGSGLSSVGFQEAASNFAISNATTAITS